MSKVTCACGHTIEVSDKNSAGTNEEIAVQMCPDCFKGSEVSRYLRAVETINPDDPRKYDHLTAPYRKKHGIRRKLGEWKSWRRVEDITYSTIDGSFFVGIDAPDFLLLSKVDAGRYDNYEEAMARQPKDHRKAYDERKGMVSKSYKLPKDLVQRFADACADNDDSQAAALATMMEEYINKA